METPAQVPAMLVTDAPPTHSSPAPAASLAGSSLAHRHGGTLLLYGLALAGFALIRLALTLHTAGSVDWGLRRVVGVAATGLLYDLATASYLGIPIVLYLSLVPQRVFAHRLHRMALRVSVVVGVYVLLVCGVTEWLFWTEFGSRFNFIAIDYLVYTREVLGNIGQSYPVVPLLGLPLIASFLLYRLLVRWNCLEGWLGSRTPPRARLAVGALLLIPPILFTAALDNRSVPDFGNTVNQELARNGVYAFAAALRDNQLDYEKFYETRGSTAAFLRLRELLSADDASFVSADPTDVRQLIRGWGEERRFNVIQITVESLSASFLGKFGNPEGLTPNLDRLADQGLLFTRLYATGTRTARGMEALTLALPPTPGLSIVKRPHNENLFTLGSVFRDRGYETTFLYGGYGYFDNMNYFFSHNGYDVVDLAAKPATAVSFSTIWGACDENLYAWVLEEADRSYARGRPFHHFVMTTSNHRPYTYPSGRIDIPSGSGRRGAVKYTDFAIGEFLRLAQAKPWYDNTLFVIVADHCASSAGKDDLPVENYRIPLIVYNPALVAPRRIDTLCSQIDVAPTLLGLLGWSYESRFIGRDVLRADPAAERALIANYQKLGLLQDGHLAVLEPVHKQAVYACDPQSGALSPASADDGIVDDAIAYYETASYVFSHGLYGAIPRALQPTQARAAALEGGSVEH